MFSGASLGHYTLMHFLICIIFQIMVIQSLKSSSLSVGDVLKPLKAPYQFFQNAYIRDIYVKLWSQLCSDMMKQEKLFSLVVGAAGTGKSSFLCYALAKALHQANVMQETDAVDAGTELLFN